MTQNNKIDLNFDFTSEVKGFWDESRRNAVGLIYPNTHYDPDNKSCTMQNYHALLWSKPLPNGDKMNLKKGYGCYYLTWNNFRFGADSIINIYVHHKKMHQIIDEVRKTKNNFVLFYEKYLRTSYTIAGSIIFPKNGKTNSINCARNSVLGDRFDLTLECIRKYYNNEKSPLSKVLEANAEFFKLFVDFKGYIDFFFLNDLVENGKIKFFFGDGHLDGCYYPKNAQEWNILYTGQMYFLEARKNKIAEYLNKK